MYGLDTNVLVRFFTQDDPIQSRKATAIVERRLTPENPGFVSLVTMVETVWVLASVYQQTGRQIAGIVERMLQADSLVVQNEQEVFIAAQELKRGHAAFADALIGALGAWAGCGSTLTFDKRAARLKTFEVV
jgi:predicted nucleic-acid-binding protein